MQPVSYTSLEPSNLTAFGINAPSFKAGESISFFATSSFIFGLCFAAIVLGAVVKLAEAGVLRIKASEASIRQSNENIKKVTLGLLGTFSLFLILFTVNKGLVNGEIGLGALATKGTSTSISLGAQAPSGGAGSPSGNSSMQNAINEDPVIREKLRQLGITVNKSVCSSPTATDCTTVGGMHPETFVMLQSLKSTCSGSIQVTGGTEAGHSSHGPGRSPIDLGINDSTLNACVRNFTQGPTLGFCKATYKNFGYIFCDEKNTAAHWHVYK